MIKSFIWAYAQSGNVFNTLAVGGGSGAGNAATNIAFYTATDNTTTVGTKRMQINDDGDVAIGNQTPTAKLHIKSNGTTSSTSAILVDDSSNSDIFELKDDGEVVIYSDLVLDSGNNVRVVTGSGSPESSITAGVGSTYHRTDGGSGTSFYVKESGTGNTGWVAK